MVTLEDARKATDSIVKTLHPFSVVLFGSVAREGNYIVVIVLINLNHRRILSIICLP